MALLKGSEPWAMTADQAAQRKGFAARSELALRAALERFCRARWPDARIVHEIVMGEGRVRADVAAICSDHVAAFEVKGQFDDMTRLLHQVGMYQLCVPEVWMVVSEIHCDDAKLIRHLLPSVGLATGPVQRYTGNFLETEFDLTVVAEAVPRPVVPEMMLQMAWAAELKAMCDRTKTMVPRRASRAVMVKALLDLPIAVLQREVCTELRRRDALWRADPICEAAE